MYNNNIKVIDITFVIRKKIVCITEIYWRYISYTSGDLPKNNNNQMKKKLLI